MLADKVQWMDEKYWAEMATREISQYMDVDVTQRTLSNFLGTLTLAVSYPFLYHFWSAALAIVRVASSRVIGLFANFTTIACDQPSTYVRM